MPTDPTPTTEREKLLLAAHAELCLERDDGCQFMTILRDLAGDVEAATRRECVAQVGEMPDLVTERGRIIGGAIDRELTMLTLKVVVRAPEEPPEAGK